jgi:hypothetical protein
MTTALIIGGVLLVGVGLVASQLVRLKDWLDRQPPPPDDGDSSSPSGGRSQAPAADDED